MYTKFDVYFGIFSGSIILMLTILNIFFSDIDNYLLYKNYFLKIIPIILIVIIFRYIQRYQNHNKG